ncbi:MAG: carboxypeptidase-like regulatory domain-containing protein [Myxococcales bacterium]|jgi:hypothetical protein
MRNRNRPLPAAVLVLLALPLLGARLETAQWPGLPPNLEGRVTGCEPPSDPSAFAGAARWLAVEVVDLAGRPVPEALVELVAADEQTTGTAGKDGCESFLDLGEKSYAITVRAGELQPSEPVTVSLGRAGGHWLRVMLSPGLSIQGRVLDGGGSPVAGAEIVWSEVEAEVPEAALFSKEAAIAWKQGGRTDEEGRFVLRGLRKRPHRVVAGLRPVRTPAAIVEPLGAPVELVLRRPASEGTSDRAGPTEASAESSEPPLEWRGLPDSQPTPPAGAALNGGAAGQSASSAPER